MRTVTWDGGFYWDDPNIHWGNPAYQLEPGDPGYVPWTPPHATHSKPKKMKHQPYLPDDDAGISTLLMTFHMGLTDPMATKYNVTPEQRWRLHRGHLVFDYLLELSSIYADHCKSLTAIRNGMFEDGEGADPIP
ncbi:MAG: hypothetical protein ABMA13_05490, partial [Chthoniobacteraceae bacterium]